jgi:hypothetical protein
MQQELVDRCKKVGCRVSEFIKAAIDFAVHDHVEFDFGNEDEDAVEPQESKAKDSARLPCLELAGKCSSQESHSKGKASVGLIVRSTDEQFPLIFGSDFVVKWNHFPHF